MKVYTKECPSCNEPWVYVRLTRREAALFVADAPSTGQVIPKVTNELKKYGEEKP